METESHYRRLSVYVSVFNHKLLSAVDILDNKVTYVISCLYAVRPGTVVIHISNNKLYIHEINGASSRVKLDSSLDRK